MQKCVNKGIWSKDDIVMSLKILQGNAHIKVQSIRKEIEDAFYYITYI
jgi:hypothetical protein